MSTFVMYIIMKALNGFPMTHRQVTLKDVQYVGICNVRKVHWSRTSDAVLAVRPTAIRLHTIRLV